MDLQELNSIARDLCLIVSVKPGQQATAVAQALATPAGAAAICQLPRLDVVRIRRVHSSLGAQRFSIEFSHHGAKQQAVRACLADARVAVEPDLAPSARAAKRQAVQQLRAVANEVYCSGHALFYQPTASSRFHSVPFRDAVAVAAALRHCRALRLQQLDQQRTALHVRIRTLSAQQAQQQRQQHHTRMSAGSSGGGGSNGDADGTCGSNSGSRSGSTDGNSFGSGSSSYDGGSSASGSSSDDDGSSDGGSSSRGHKYSSEGDDYYQAVAKYAGLPCDMFEAAGWPEDDD